VRSLTPDEIASPTEKQACLDFGIEVEKKLGTSMTNDDFKDDPEFTDFESPHYVPYEDEVPPSQMLDIDDVRDVDNYDPYVGAQVRLPIGDDIRNGKVIQRKCELDGTVKGRANENSMLDTRTYEIEFPDGCSDEYTANAISENKYAQYDEDGN
jgi:hypothetical protein